MSGTRLRSSVVLLALIACACLATARGIATVPAPARQPSVTTDVVYGHKDGLALTFDVYRPAQPNGAGVISIVSIRQHAGEYGVDPNRIGVLGGSAGGQLALLLGTTADSGNPSASDAVLRESSRVAAVVAYFPPTDLSRWGTQLIRQAFPAMRLTDAEAAEYSPIRFVTPGAAPSLIVHGDADTTVPMVEGETMHGALTKAGVPASFIRIEGAGHGFEGADLERANAAMVQWFERHLGSAANAGLPRLR
jgi:acetyl esterase/lipase